MEQVEQVSDAELGAMVREILQHCPNFQIYLSQTDTRFVEVTSLFRVDLAPQQMEKIKAALDKIANLHRQHIVRTEDTWIG